MKIFLVSIFSLLVSYCFPQIIRKQVKIPLNNNNGVPYYIGDMGAYVINGFEVDTAGNYYFMAGNYQKGTTTLTVFNGDKQKYRKTYNIYFANNIIINTNKIYLLDNSYTSNPPRKIKNDFYELEIKDGKIVKKQNHIIENKINSYEYFDSLIVLWLFENTEQVTGRTPYFFALLNLKGQVVGKAENQNDFNLSDSLLLKHQKNVLNGQFLGRWKDFYLFWGCEVIKPGPNGIVNYKFYFENTHGKIIGISTFDDKIFGRKYLTTDNSSRKLRNGNIYIANRDEQNVLITELSVEELYKDALLHKP